MDHADVCCLEVWEGLVGGEGRKDVLEMGTGLKEDKGMSWRLRLRLWVLFCFAEDVEYGNSEKW